MATAKKQVGVLLSVANGINVYLALDVRFYRRFKATTKNGLVINPEDTRCTETLDRA